MASPFLFLTGTLLFLLTITSSHALVNPSAPKAISDLKEAIVKGLGFQTDDFKISGFDIRDSLVGQSVAYEFHIEIDNKVLPFKLLEDVNRWQHVDLPVLRTPNQEDNKTPNSNSLSSVKGNQRLDDERVLPVLAPFQLAGPMELWIQDAKDIRLSLPHDVDAGILKKVILADGAVVTVKGARSVSLRQPLELPLPLNTTSEGGFASGLLTLSERLRVASQNQETPIVSVRIVGPTSLTSPSDSTTPRASNRLKLKRLAPGLVELSSPPSKIEAVSGLHEEIGITTMWPLAAVNGSNSNLRGFETLLYSVLGEKVNKKGSFKLLKAEASAQTYLKMVFGVEKELKEGDKTVDWEEFPAWKTKPESVKMHFEVLAKVDGDKVLPEKVMQVPDPFVIEDSVAPNVLTGNLTMSSLPVIYPPPNFFTL